MNKLVYVGVLVIIVVIVAAIVGFGGLLSHPGKSSTTTVATTVATTFPYSTNVTTTANTSQNYSAAVCSRYSGYDCVPLTCTAQPGFTCGNVTYLYSPKNGSTYLFARISQQSGQLWSGFGVGYAPNGTFYNGGIPAIAFYNANASSSNVGTQLQSNTPVQVIADNGLADKFLGATTGGSLWVCYTNSGVIYVGTAGCTQTGGGSAIPTYVKIGVVS